MRKELEAKFNDKSIEKRSKYTGIFENFGTKSGYKHTLGTVLLLNITDDKDKLMTDHLWFNLTKAFIKLYKSNELKRGSIISFWGRTDIYAKGYYKDDIDYKLSYPTKVEIIGFNNEYIDNCIFNPPFIWEEELEKIKEQQIKNSEIISNRVNELKESIIPKIEKITNKIQISLDIYLN